LQNTGDDETEKKKAYKTRDTEERNVMSREVEERIVEPGKIHNSIFSRESSARESRKTKNTAEAVFSMFAK